MSIRSKTYLFFMALLSIFIFLYFSNLENISYSLEEWTWIYFLSFAAFLLCEFEVKIEQSRGSFSMESAVFLATVLYFGIELSLIVLVLFFTISVFYNKKTPIMAHVFNFLMYSIMLTATYHTFVWLREELDGQGLENIFPYIVALFVYLNP